MRTYVPRNFVGHPVYVVQVHFSEQSQNQGGGKRITRANSIDHIYRTRSAIGPPLDAILLLMQQAAVRSTCECDNLQAECLRQAFDLMFKLVGTTTRIIAVRSSEVEHRGQRWQFIIIQLQHVGQPQRFFDHIARIELLPQIDITNAQGMRWRLRDQLSSPELYAILEECRRHAGEQYMRMVQKFEAWVNAQAEQSPNRID